MHTALNHDNEVFLVDTNFDLPHDVVETFELAKLRAVLVAVLFRLLPLINNLLLDAQLLVVLGLSREKEFFEHGHLCERLDLVHVAQSHECALQERYRARRALFLLLDAAKFDELF